MPRLIAAAAVIVIAAIGGLVFVANRSGPAVGSTPSPSASATASPVMPAFHNNGAIVVIANGLHAINPATGRDAKAIHLPEAPDAYDVSWSPDGMQLAYAAPGGLWVADVLTGDSQQITYCGTEISACHLAWSPDGSVIAVARGGSGIELLDPLTGESSMLETPAGTIQPTWSPDGSRIAFQAIEGFGTGYQQRRLYAIRRDGSDLTLLLESEAESLGAWDPSWSPDGSTIAYLGSTPTADGTDGDVLHLMLLEFDGSEPSKLVDVGSCFCVGFAPGLTWSPDGMSLALNVPGSGNYGLHIVNADGTDFHRVSDGALAPAWRPVP